VPFFSSGGAGFRNPRRLRVVSPSALARSPAAQAASRKRAPQPCTRSRSPELHQIRAIVWSSPVVSDTTSSVAISWFDIPRAISLKTSISRCVSSSEPAGRGSPLHRLCRSGGLEKSGDQPPRSPTAASAPSPRPTDADPWPQLICRTSFKRNPTPQPATTHTRTHPSSKRRQSASHARRSSAGS